MGILFSANNPCSTVVSLELCGVNKRGLGVRGHAPQWQRETQFANKLLDNDNVMIKHRGYTVCVCV